MDIEFAVARIIHIVFGSFWVGAAIFMAAILQPRLRALGPTVQGAVMSSLMPIMVPAMLGSAGITILAGTYLTLRLRWGHLDTFLSTGWGWAILIGFVASLAAFGTGYATGQSGKKMVALGASVAGRPPEPHEMARIQQLGLRLTRLGRSSAILVVIAVGSMASARFI